MISIEVEGERLSLKGKPDGAESKYIQTYIDGIVSTIDCYRPSC